jgi:DNA-directed RNA polymerase omega subunit
MAAAKRARQIANEGKELQPGVREKAVSQAANDIYDGKTVVLE